MKTILAIACLLILLTNDCFAQSVKGIPKSLMPTTVTNGTPPSLDSIYTRYRDLISNPDTNLRHEKNKASRWMYYTFGNYDVNSKYDYNHDGYSEALKAIYNSNLNCGANDPANWVSDGPQNIPESYQGAPGGWVDAVYNNPNSINEFLVGTRTSGILKSDNFGDNWYPVTDDTDFPVLGVRQIIADPNNPEYLIAITGTEYIEGGVVFSNNGGDTWNQINQSTPQFFWLDYHPTIPGLVFAAAKSEIWYSLDYGMNWFDLPSMVNYPDHTNFDKIIVLEDELYVTTEYWYGPGCNLYNASLIISPANVLLFWQGEVTANFIGLNQSEFCDFSNKTHNNQRFLIEFVTGNGSIVTVFQTTDQGTSFTDVSTPGMPPGRYYKSELIASPNDINRFYMASTFMMETFDVNLGGLGPFQDTPGELGHHSDYRSSHIINNNGMDRLTLGNDGGIAFVENAFTPSPTMRSIYGDLSVNLVHTFDYNEKTGRTLYAFQDHSQRYKDANNTYSGLISLSFEGSTAMIQEGHNDAFVVENAYNSIRDNGGTTRSIVYDYVNGLNYLGISGNCFLGGYFYPGRHYPVKFIRGFAKANSETEASVGLNRDIDMSKKVAIPNSGMIGAVAFCESNPKFMMAAEFERIDQPYKLYRSVNEGDTWDDMSTWNNNQGPLVNLSGVGTQPLNEQLIWNHVRAIEFDPYSPRVIYLGIGGVHRYNGVITDERFRVIMSEDDGATYKDISEGLPAFPVERLLKVESDNGLMFCGTSVGVYYRTDNMNQWECFSKGLPKAQITHMQYDYCENVLYVSTYGRGMWKTPVPVGIRDEITSEIAILNPTVWDKDYRATRTVRVLEGNTLEIQGDVYFDKDKKLIVEAGARLIINGGKLSNVCNSLWPGIEVHGNNGLIQNSVNQGVVEMKNQAVIENAVDGIRTIATLPGGGLDWSKTGGIIKISEGSFINCKRGIEFMKYHNLAPNGNELNNQSFIYNCDFIIDEELPDGNVPYAGISMYDVLGLKIRSSSFKNLRPDINNVQENLRGSGIHTIDASYKVTSGYSLGNGAPVLGTENYFQNLWYGVLATGGTSPSNISVKDNYFINCASGVGLTGTNYGLIARNDFKIPGGTGVFFDDPVSGAGSYDYAYGVYTAGAWGFNIQGNGFDTYLPSGYSKQATHIKNSSIVTGSKVYNNEIVNFALGTRCAINNSNLIIDCNQYIKGISSGNVWDIYNGGDLADQGICQDAEQVNNEFVGNCDNTNLYQIKNDGLPFLYNYQFMTIDPSCHNLGANAIECSPSLIDNPCNDELPPDIPFPIGTTISDLQGALLNLENEINASKTILKNGDAQYLYDAINTQSGAQLKNTLLQESPYLSDGVLIAYLEKVPTPPYGYLKSIIVDNSRVTQEVMDVVNTKPFPAGMYNQIVAAQDEVSERKLLESRIRTLNAQRLSTMDQVVRIYLDTNWLDSALVFLEDEGSMQALCALVPLEMRHDTTRVTTHITTLRGVADSLELVDSTDIMISELRSFCDFHERMKKITHQYGGYFNLAPNDLAFIENIATSDYAVSDNAQAILDFIKHRLPVYEDEIALLAGGNQRGSNSNNKTSLGTDSKETILTVVPNPSTGSVVFNINSEVADHVILISDLYGRRIASVQVNGNSAEYNFINVAEGVYIVRLYKGMELLESVRVLYDK